MKISFKQLARRYPQSHVQSLGAYVVPCKLTLTIQISCFLKKIVGSRYLISTKLVPEQSFSMKIKFHPPLRNVNQVSSCLDIAADVVASLRFHRIQVELHGGRCESESVIISLLDVLQTLMSSTPSPGSMATETRLLPLLVDILDTGIDIPETVVPVIGILMTLTATPLNGSVAASKDIVMSDGCASVAAETHHSLFDEDLGVSNSLCQCLLRIMTNFRYSTEVINNTVQLLLNIMKHACPKHGNIKGVYTCPPWLTSPLRNVSPLLVARGRALLNRFSTLSGKDKTECGGYLKVLMQLLNRISGCENVLRGISSGGLCPFLLWSLSKLSSEKTAVGKSIGTIVLGILKNMLTLADPCCANKLRAVGDISTTMLPYIQEKVSGSSSKSFIVAQAVLWGWLYHSYGHLGCSSYTLSPTFSQSLTDAQRSLEKETHVVLINRATRESLGPALFEQEDINKGFYNFFCGHFTSILPSDSHSNVLTLNWDELPQTPDTNASRTWGATPG